MSKRQIELAFTSAIVRKASASCLRGRIYSISCTLKRSPALLPSLFLWCSRWNQIRTRSTCFRDLSFDGLYTLVIGRIASISASLYYGRIQQTGSCITVYLLKGVHKSIHLPSFQNCLSLGFSGLLPVSFPAFSLDSRISFHQSFRQTLYAHSYYQKHSQ